MILVCLALIVLAMLAKPLKFLFRILRNGVLGSIAIGILHACGFPIGVNICTAGFVAILGLPGFAGLVALHFLL